MLDISHKHRTLLLDIFTLNTLEVLCDDGVAETQLVPGMEVTVSSWHGGVVVEPPTSTTRADIGCWNKSWVGENVLHNRGTVNEMLGRFRLEGPLAVVTKNSLCLLRAWGEVEGKPEILTTCPPLQMDENACG